MRRTKRLVAVAGGALMRPGGKVTEVFPEAAEREGAFRFLENDEVPAAAIQAAAGRAAARRSAEYSHVYVPMDGTSLSITDEQRSKGLGLVGARRKGATGLQVMSAIAVAPDGTPLGLLGQQYWARAEPSTTKDHKHDKRPTAEKETKYWHVLMDQVCDVFAAQAPSTRPWFQFDRGGDAQSVHLHALLVSGQATVTVRAAQDRRLADAEGPDYLWSRLESQASASTYELDVPATDKRAARKATMLLRYAEIAVGVELPSFGRVPVPMWAVLAVEEGTTPAGEEPLEWLLLTTHAVDSAQEAEYVVFGYSTRWKVEQFHKTWKTGACRVEDTQLREEDHIERWAIILAAVSMRILRLTYLSRVTPDAPATVELSPTEIEATILLRKPKGVRRKDTPTIAQAVRWIADLGGYTGKSSGGPPGALVLARGLHRIDPVVIILSDGVDL